MRVYSHWFGDCFLRWGGMGWGRGVRDVVGFVGVRGCVSRGGSKKWGE